MLLNVRQGEHKMKLQRIEEDQALYEERHEASVALRNTTKSNAESRRKSFAFRNGDARRIRQLHKQMEEEKWTMEHQRFELKRLAEKDAEEYQRQLAKARRESLANRNEYARQQREEDDNRATDAKRKEHQSYELKWAAERDAHAKRARKRRRTLE